MELTTNYVGGAWREATGTHTADVWNPATGAVIARARFSNADDVATAVREADHGARTWRRVPATERAQYLFRLKESLERRAPDLARSITEENGKAEASGEVRRAIDNVDMACATPVLLQGRFAEDIAWGFFVGATVLDDVAATSTIATTEVFGPVLGITRARDLDEALALVNGGRYGNMACLFTGSGQAARRFRYEARAGNIGINVGVAQPMASFPFSGWGDSFFGDVHAHGQHAIEFFTQTKVIVERWS